MKYIISDRYKRKYSLTVTINRVSKRLFTTVIVGLLLAMISLSPASGQSGNSHDVRYTLSPVGIGTAWNNSLGLKDGFLYGGKLGIDFGPLIGLEVSYLTNGNLKTDFSRIELFDTAGVIVTDQRVKVKRYGGDLLLRWPSDKVAPFVKVGGGVIRFEPVDGERAEKVEVRFGGGFDYIVSRRVRARAWVEMNRFRLDRYSLAPGGATNGQYPLDPESDEIRNNLSIGLSLDYALGQSRFRSIKGNEKIQPFSILELEPVIGRLNFDDASISNITVAGVRLGGELNPWVGWALFYWHGMEDDFSDSRPLQSYGGEARLSLASKSGPQPYLTIGAGQLDFGSSFTDNDGVGREDKTALILGAGIRAEIIKSVLLNVGVRDYMYSQGRLDRISGTDEISHNWLVSGALVFGLGGGGGNKRTPTIAEPLRFTDQSLPQAKDSLPMIEARPMATETTVTATKPEETKANSGYVSEKNIVIPVPLEGEIYIRYGAAAPDAEKKLIGNLPNKETIKPDSVASVVVPQKSVTVDSVAVTAAVTPAPLSRSELDSLLNVLRADISAMLAASAVRPTVEQPVIVTGGSSPVEDSLITSLKAELAKTELARRHLDSLLEAQRQSVVPPQRDTLVENKIQQAIAEQVAASLAAKPEAVSGSVTQADLNAMMSALAGRMDSITSQRAAADSARMRDQLQLEVIRQTKSQEEFNKALEDFKKQYDQRISDRSVVPPAIIVNQPAATPQPTEREEPKTVVIKPETQYMVVRDSTNKITDTLAVTDFKVEAQQPVKEKSFIDLKPSAYTGFGLEKPKQFIIGSRFDIGPITSKEERLRLVPEFALGFGGGGVSVMAVLNAEYGLTVVELGDYLMVPYVRMGFGVLGFGGDIVERDTEGVLNFTYGFSINPKKTRLFRGIGDPSIFVEHQIIDLFDLNRIVIGFQWSP